MIKKPRRSARKVKAATWRPPKTPATVLLIGDDLLAASRECPHLAATAIHEAGHVLGARYFNHPIKTVTLEDDMMSGCMQVWPRRSTPEEIRQTLVILGCGQAASRHYRPEDHGVDDSGQMKENVRRLVGLLAPQDAADAEISLARRRAEKLIQTQWPDVLAIAGKLLEFHTLTNGVAGGSLTDLD